MNVYQVVGGWQAQDNSLRIACFGKTEAEAIEALHASQKRAEALNAAAAKSTAMRHASDSQTE